MPGSCHYYLLSWPNLYRDGMGLHGRNGRVLCALSTHLWWQIRSWRSRQENPLVSREGVDHRSVPAEQTSLGLTLGSSRQDDVPSPSLR